MSIESELRAQLNESEMHRHELMERLQDRCDEIAALQSERDALREALKLARTRMAHRIGCATINPTEEWAEKGSVNVDDCHCEISVIDAALSTPASGEPASERHKL